MEVRMFTATGIVLWLALGLSSGNELPATIKKCTYGDTKCIAETVTMIMKEYPQGIPEIKLKSVDPLYFDSMEITQEGKSTNGVSLTLSVKNVTLQGWSKMVVKEVVGFERDPRKSKFEFRVFIPKDLANGQYIVNGKALLLRLQGHGHATVECIGLDLYVKLKTNVITKDGEDYLHIKHTEVNGDLTNMISQFDNLLNDKVISDNINKLINNNFQYLRSEIKDTIADIRGTLIAGILAPVLETIPYRKFFAEE